MTINNNIAASTSISIKAQTVKNDTLSKTGKNDRVNFKIIIHTNSVVYHMKR